MDVFDLVAKIRLDSSEYEQGVGKAKGTFSTLASGVKNGLATVAKVGAAAVTAGVAGVAALTKMGVEGYAQYEQLAGGVETLFKSSQGTVMQYAENAYKTAGMSANQYMETVTSFSASLIQSLDGDTAKAAEVGNMAITDMSDNANKMGTSMEMIQNAYQGFAKQNYTMLDNLKLGYGGTKEEMQRLLDKAGEISGIKYDISSFSDISEAIHVIQQDMEISGISYEEAMAKVASGEMTMKEAMDAMGTTAREAATTIEGSLNMMKGAWQNLVVGMADENANMEVLINNFVESTATAAQNLLPRIEQTLSGIGQLIEKLAPIIGEAVPKLVESVLPSFLSAGISLITALVSGIVAAAPGIYNALLDAVYMALTDVFGMSEESANTFVDTVDGIVQDLIAFFQAIPVALNWMVTQAQTEGTVFNTIWETIKSVVSAAVDFIRSTIQLFTAILTGDWSSAWQSIQDILDTVVVALYDIISAGLELVWGFISEIIGKIVEYFSEQWNEIKAECVRVWDMIKTSTTQAWNNIKAGLSSAWNAIKSLVSSAINGVKSTISSAWETIKSVTSSVWNGIKSTVGNVWNGIKSTVSGAVNGVKSAISTGLETAKASVSGALDGIKTKFTTIWDNCKSIVKNAVSALKNALNFSWSLPDLKLPHISVSGGKAPYGIGGKGSLPSFSIEWYKKAYDNAMILSKPTIFGYSDGKFLGGGDGNGNEIVAGESYLMRLISNAVDSRNEKIVTLLAALLEATVDGNTKTVRALMADKTFAVGEREFARLVKQYA